ncbi:MAG: hypothetical protein DRN05_06400 [Thermoplasmata archaeon]|nr:MAG: hypothetical protein DRN05_06400 [Thermoplasmata archaeon]
MITYNMNTNNQKYWKNTKLTTILILAITILTLIHTTLVFADNNIISNTKTVTHPPTEMIITTKKSETTPMPKNIIYVDDNNTQGPWDGTIEHPYQHIQDGINASTHHDIIYIFRGIYRENIIVNKSITLLGENRNHTIVDGTNKGIVADITANHVNIKNLTFRNSGGFAYNAGVILRKNSCHIDNCTFYRHRTSIYIENNSDNNIDSCIIHTNKKGILIDHSYNTTIQNCLFSHNAIALHLNHTSSIKIKNSYVYENGIGCLLHNTSKTLIHHCAINDNNDNQAGIIIKKCIRTKISNSNICHNGVGIKIIESSSINITKSDLKWNTHVAIQIKKSRKNITISNCEIAENLRFGAHATDSNCKFVKNNFYKNAIYGMFSRSSTCHAKLNWWGSITGPALTGLGPSDRITRIIGRVIYTPWLLRPLKNVGSDWATDDFFSKVNVSIERKRLVLPGLDSDGDGVPDWWEVKWGYDPLVWDDHVGLDPDGDGLNNVEECFTDGWGSSPFVRDVFLELDWMVSGCSGASNKPGRWFVDRLVWVFARHNVSLHVDVGVFGGGEEVPLVEDMSYDVLCDLYWRFFLHNDPCNPRKGVFHYGLICDYGPDAGFAFIGWDHLDSFIISAQALKNKFSIYPRSLLIIAGSMHELGHTFGLLADDFDGIDNKAAVYPFFKDFWLYKNYRSCMNYRYTWSILDYSDGTHGKRDFNDWDNLDFTFFKNTHFEWPKNQT